MHPTHARKPPSQTKDAILADVLADLGYALKLQATGRRDLEFERRGGEQTEKIRQETLAKHGVLNVAVDLIREGRDEE